jgi:DNA replication and repair protein RecF
MQLRTLRLKQFRNHPESVFDFGNGTNVLVGGNGQGKTNVIEAISYLCLTKSFFAGSDALSVMFGADTFEVQGGVMSDGDVPFEVRIAFSPQESHKAYSINRHPVEPLSSVVGKFPVVICSPEHAPITSQGPAERRKFVDIVVSQSSANYFRHLLEYRRVIRQRNRVLFDARVSRNSPGAAIEPWNDQLVQHGSYVSAKRQEFVSEFSGYVTSAYHRLIGDVEEPALGYQPHGETIPSGIDEWSDFLRAEIRSREMEERRMGTTLVGPHRDEFPMTINNRDLRSYASQGQHKTFLVALKVGEFFYLQERCHETPIVLLDDVFSELDDERSGRLLDFLGTLSQIFITSTHARMFDRNGGLRSGDRMFRISGGHIE